MYMEDKMQDIIIIDNFLESNIQDSIEEELLSARINWTFGRKLNYIHHQEVSEKQKSSMMGFTHLILKDNEIYSDKLNLYCQPILAAESLFGFKIQHLFNCRCQLQLPINNDEAHGIPHVDGQDINPYKVFLYYVNDADGETIIFNETTKTTTPEQIRNKEYTERMRVYPKKGRMVIMDGDIYHASGRPKNDIRMVLNYNAYINE